MKKLVGILLIFLLAGILLFTVGCAAGGARSGDTVKVDYTLKLADGTIYDTSIGKKPLQFTLGSGQAIAGFDKAVVGMEIGQTKVVTIPAAQAYGAEPDASNPLAGKDLTFTIKLLQIVK